MHGHIRKTIDLCNLGQVFWLIPKINVRDLKRDLKKCP